MIGKAFATSRRHYAFGPLWMLALPLLLFAESASSTWSVVAVDVESGKVGAAGASCVGNVERIVGLAPRRGAIVAQALPSGKAKKKALKMLTSKANPKKIINKISKPEFDANYMDCQYAVAALTPDPSAAAYTGSRNYDWAGHKIGEGVSVQGNYLAGPEVLNEALSAFDDTKNDGLPLADRLGEALKAGSKQGGDRRCGPQRALSAFLFVAKPGDEPGKPSLKVLIPEQNRGGPNPVKMLLDELQEASSG